MFHCGSANIPQTLSTRTLVNSTSGLRCVSSSCDSTSDIELASCQALAEEESRAWYTLFVHAQSPQDSGSLETSGYYSVILSSIIVLPSVALAQFEKAASYKSLGTTLSRVDA